MNNKLHHPILFILVGIPGSGKTYLARQLSQQLKISRVSAEQIRATILNQPSMSRAEEKLVRKIALFLIEELFKFKMSVICDIPAQTLSQQTELHKLAKTYKFKVITIYQQVDQQAAWLRCQSRSSHQVDDKYALDLSLDVFNALCKKLEPPIKKEIIVVSGTHTFNAQFQTILRRLIELQFLTNENSLTKNIPKPGLVNLVSSKKISLKPSSLHISLNKRRRNKAS